MTDNTSFIVISSQNVETFDILQMFLPLPQSHQLKTVVFIGPPSTFTVNNLTDSVRYDYELMLLIGYRVTTVTVLGK